LEPIMLPPGLSFVQRHLSLGDRLAEILCGLIMVLTFTLAAGLTVAEGPDAAFTLLIAAIGCNVAWGIIDGVLYVLTAMSGRSKRVRLIRAVQDAVDETSAIAVIRPEVEERLQTLATPQARDALCRDILTQMRIDAAAAHAVTQARARTVTADDLAGAVAIFWLEVVACVPAIVPFILLPHDHLLALRLSNALLVITLFIVGRKWAHYVGLNHLLTGLLMAGIGIGMVGVAILLGG
jgi:VIT1/CCC1 family predicted Fe2+/Mn2+ transporter